MIGTRHRSNQELIGQGVANLGSALFGGLPATGAIARTATNIRSGAKTSVAGMLHAAFLLVFILFGTDLMAPVPMAALARSEERRVGQESVSKCGSWWSLDH